VKGNFKKAAYHLVRATPLAILLKIGLVVFWLISSSILVVGFYTLANARSAGEGIGSTAGTLAGKAVGSFEGVTHGIKEGSSDGTAAGLQADDTTVMLQEIQSAGRLQVLVVDINLDIFHMIGKDGETATGIKLDVQATKDANFVALYKQSGHATFTVDLNKATIQTNGSGVIVALPEPEVEVVSDAELVPVGKWQKGDYTGSAEKGQLGLLNSLREIDGQTVKELQNYDALIDQARDSAKAQVEALAVSVRSSDGPVEIVFEN